LKFGGDCISIVSEVKNLLRKIVVFSWVGGLAALGLGACMDAVGVREFFDDDVVVEIVHRNRVGLNDKTGHGLRVGDGLISGLRENAFYFIEIYDDEDFEVQNGAGYVGSNGRLFPNLGSVFRGGGEGKTVFGLNNAKNYMVYAAKPYSGPLNIFDFDGKTAPNLKSTDSSGLLEIDENWQGFSLNLPNDTTIANASVINVDGKPSIRMDQTRYYLFHDPANPDNFLYIYVSIEGVEEIPAGSLIINITFSITGGVPVFDSDVKTIAQADFINGDVDGIEINIMNADGMTNIIWLYDNVQVGTGESLDLAIDFGDGTGIEYAMKGSHVFTVMFDMAGGAGERYSAQYIVVIN
jgi:hypothetical protein